MNPYGSPMHCSQPLTRRCPAPAPALTIGQGSGRYFEARTRRVSRGSSHECNDGQVPTEKPARSAGKSCFYLLKAPSLKRLLEAVQRLTEESAVVN
jgi:hypothetical protein